MEGWTRRWPPSGSRSWVPRTSCRARYSFHAALQPLAHARRNLSGPVVLLRLHGVKELLQLVVTGVGQFRLHAAVREVGEARVADHVAGVACYHEAAGVAVGESWVLRLLVVSKASSLSMMSSQRPSPC